MIIRDVVVPACKHQQRLAVGAERGRHWLARDEMRRVGQSWVERHKGGARCGGGRDALTGGQQRRATLAKRRYSVRKGAGTDAKCRRDDSRKQESSEHGAPFIRESRGVGASRLRSRL